ncbi:hypothetical protein MML48_9g00001212 [Holotrichia oblita]|uniref:Uncharacterized protein n=1 Tax=Holotrichia oblita TaxID=644536 RepID=A0ACB9SKT7_HOLOL|nr:hypothetical protein MML48_9g00001212 [Holotrichia oblita]
MNYLISIAPGMIKFPRTHEEMVSISDAFEQVSGFPNVIGCVDGTYIIIRTPVHKIKSTYVNRHHQTALTLQGICDNKKRFIDVFTGPPSKNHDSRDFNLSFISKELPYLCGERVHLLGDSAYALAPYLMTPYRDYGKLTLAEQSFNRTLSKTRVVIDFHTVEKT